MSFFSFIVAETCTCLEDEGKASLPGRSRDPRKAVLRTNVGGKGRRSLRVLLRTGLYWALPWVMEPWHWHKTLLTVGRGRGSCPWGLLTFVVTRRIVIHESHALREKFIKVKSRGWF